MEPPATHRLKLTVHYDGAAFHGWQLQPDRRTVQGDLEAALSRLADTPTSIMGAGRTDAGVHATGQVAAVDMPAHWSAPELLRSLNAVLSADVWVADVQPVSSDFHPRYDATARRYLYRIGLAPESASPFHARWCWPLRAVLDHGELQAAADLVVGEHSFRAFAKAGQPERGERCDVAEAAWERWDLGVELSITADRYLHHMVRYLVGTMVDVARGRRPLEDVSRLLANEPEVVTSPPAPPEGLYLSEVRYPPSSTNESPETHHRRSTAPA